MLVLCGPSVGKSFWTLGETGTTVVIRGTGSSFASAVKLRVEPTAPKTAIVTTVSQREDTPKEKPEIRRNTIIDSYNLGGDRDGPERTKVVYRGCPRRRWPRGPLAIQGHPITDAVHDERVHSLRDLGHDGRQKSKQVIQHLLGVSQVKPYIRG